MDEIPKFSIFGPKKSQFWTKFGHLIAYVNFLGPEVLETSQYFYTVCDFII